MTEHQRTTRLDDDPAAGAPNGGDPFDDWDLGGAPPPPPGLRFDPRLLFALIEALRRALPRELDAQFNALVRELLLTLRSLIDWYLERLERGERRPPVEEIPID